MITNRSIVSKDEIAFDFIDPLFAVVISLGFESITREPAFFGALRESWLTSPQSIYGTRASFTIAVIGLSYLTVIASLVGYHKSVLAKNIKITTIWGLLRFGADILILGFYWLLLVNYETFRFELYILVLVNVLFVAWDSLKSREYSPESYDSKQRRGVTVIWLLLFTSLYGGYLLFKAQSSLSGDLVDWLALGFAILFTLLYRVHKEKPKPRAYMERFAPHLHWRFRRKTKALYIYIAGPYTADTRERTESNVNRAIDAGILVFRKGHYPYVPHLTDLVDKRAKDIGSPIAWEEFIAWDRPWIRKADGLLYLAPSKGADIELQEAKRLGKRISYSIDDIPERIGK